MTAVTQLFPALQMMAGVTSVWAVEWAVSLATGGSMFSGPMTDTMAFAATILTAAQVAAVALVCGPVVRAAAGYGRDAATAPQVPSGPPNDAQNPSGGCHFPSTASTHQHPRT